MSNPMPRFLFCLAVSIIGLGLLVMTGFSNRAAQVPQPKKWFGSRHKTDLEDPLDESNSQKIMDLFKREDVQDGPPGTWFANAAPDQAQQTNRAPVYVYATRVYPDNQPKCSVQSAVLSD